MASGLDREKADAARAAAEEVRPGQLIALGTGTTAAFVVRELARRFPDGGGLVGVASSKGTEELAKGLGLTVRPLAPRDRFEIMLDGADEVSEALDLTKGGGGALFREKLLARRSKRLVIVVDSTKLVARLGTRAPIPVEIVPFAKPVVVDALLDRGLAPRLRTIPGTTDRPFVTENGLEILDVWPPKPLEAPEEFDADLRRLSGVVETGLFLGMADRVYVGRPDGRVEKRDRP
jgi:ribose 5-phosphate isomerase A